MTNTKTRRIVRTTWRLDLSTFEASELRDEILYMFDHAQELDTDEGVVVELDTTSANEVPDHLWSEKAEARVMFVDEHGQEVER